MSDSAENDPVEELVFRCLESGDPEQALARVQREHPEQEAEVRRILSRLADEGLIGAHALDAERPMPERLGPFRLVRELGAGGMGIVYLAEEEGLGRRVALKLIRPEHLYFPGSRERFRREVEAVARLQHGNIVPIYSVGEEDKIPYFAMEFVEGRSLAEILQELREEDPAALDGARLLRALGPRASQDGSSTSRALFEGSWPDVCVRLIAQVAEALEHAHARGVLHRDVKPSNILVSRDGRARLLDFGLARTEGSQLLTRSTVQIGSLPYLAPEQLDERTRIPSERQDVYSLGVTLYEMLALRNPFLGPTSEATRRRIVEGRVPSLRAGRPQISWELETVCLTALASAPERRYPSASAMLRDLANVAARRPITARRASAWIRMRRFFQRHPTLSTATGVAGGLVLVGALLLAAHESRARQEADALRHSAEAARTEAEQRALEATKVTDFLVDLFRHASPDQSLGAALPVRELLEQGSHRLEAELADQHAVRGRLLAAFASVHSWLDDPPRAIDFYERALAALDAAGAPPVDPERYWLRLGQARQRMVLGEYDDVRATLAALRTEATTRWSSESRYLGRLLRTEAALAELHGHIDAAGELYRESLRQIENDPQSSPDIRLDAIRALAIHLRSAHRYRESENLIERCLEHPAGGPGHPARITALRYSAENLSALGEYERARERVLIALAESERIFGRDHPMVARVLGSVAFVFRESGRHDAAAEYLERALAIAEQYRAFSPIWFVRTLDALGMSHHAMGRFERAVQLFERAREELARAFEGDHLLTAFVELHLAESLTSLNRPADAQQHAEAGLEAIERFAPHGPAHAQALGSRAWIATQNGRIAEAQEAVTAALAILKEYPHEVWSRGRTHMVQALIQNLHGAHAAAQASAETSLALLARVRPGDHPAKAMALYHLGWARLAQEDLPGAERQFGAAIAMYRRLGGTAPYPDIVWPLNHLGHALVAKRPEEAIPLLEEALVLRRQSLPPGAHWRLVTELNLGLAYERCGRFADAEPLLLAVHAVIVERYAETSPEVHASRARLFGLYRRSGQPEKAAPYAPKQR